MTETTFDLIGAEITRAKHYAGAGQMRLAVQCFVLLRALIVDHVDAVALRQAVAGQRVPLRAAREAFRSAIAARRGAGTPLLILTDGAVQTAASQGAEVSYASRLGAAMHGFRVDCIGQHLFMAADVLALLTNAPRLGAGADVILHIGQHDSMQPLLNQTELAAAGLLPANLMTQLLDFIAMHQTALTDGLPTRHEVPADRFRAHLTSILRALQTRGAQRVVMVTLPTQTGTTAHNAALLQVARQADTLVLDFDRLTRHLPSLSSPWPDALHVQVAHHIAAMLVPEPANALGQE
jgi:hypothetical protein